MEISKNADKTQLRSYIKQKRAAMTPAEEQFRNEQLFSCISTMPEVLGAPAVYSYISCKREADTRALLQFLWAHNIATAVPKVFGGGRMEFFIIQSLDDLEPGQMNIPEPKAHCRQASVSQAIVITPGLAFDRQGNRIGYGGGYYDRFFAREPQHLRIGLSFEYQFFDKLPAEDTDQTLDKIIVSGEREVKQYEFNRNR